MGAIESTSYLESGRVPNTLSFAGIEKSPVSRSRSGGYSVIMMVCLMLVCSPTILFPQVPTGSGSGLFVPGVSFSVADDPADMAVGDYNEDGFEDMVLVTGESMLAQVFLGTSEGGFDLGQVQAFDLPVEIDESDTLDYDADGFLDLILLSDSGQLYLMLGGGDGSFIDADLIDLGFSTITNFEIGDLNSDGHGDLVLTTQSGFGGGGETRILLSDGNGDYFLKADLFPNASALGIGDLDGDGDLDLALAGSTLTVHLNDGSGDFSVIQEEPLDYTVDQLLLVDVLQDRPDGIEILDIICLIDNGGALAFLQGVGSGVFSPPAEGYGDVINNASDVTPAYLGGEGTPDFVYIAAGSSSYLGVLRGHGVDGIPFEGHQSYPIPENPACMKILDYDMDGVLDVLIASSSTNAVEVFLGEPAGPDFRRGDVNSDGFFNLADPITCLQVLFLPGQVFAPCEDSMDANDDGFLDLSDPITVLAFLFGTGVPMAAPFPDCGTDPTPDVLDCQLPLNDPCS